MGSMLVIGGVVAYFGVAVALVFLLKKFNGGMPAKIRLFHLVFAIQFTLLGLRQMLAMSMHDALGRLIRSSLAGQVYVIPQVDRWMFEWWQTLNNASNFWAVVTAFVVIPYSHWLVDLLHDSMGSTQDQKGKS